MQCSLQRPQKLTNAKAAKNPLTLTLTVIQLIQNAC